MGLRIPIKPTVFSWIEWRYTMDHESLFHLDDEAYLFFNLVVKHAEAS